MPDFYGGIHGLISNNASARLKTLEIFRSVCYNFSSMSDFIEDVKIMAAEFPEERRNFIAELFTKSSAGLEREKNIISLASNEKFSTALFRLYYSINISDKYRDRVIELLAFTGTVDSLTFLFKIYESSEYMRSEIIRKILLKYGYRYVSEYAEVRESMRSNKKMVDIINSLIIDSGFYKLLTEMLDYPSEKVILYVLKQFHQVPHECVIPVISKLKNDSNWMIRFNVLQVLKQIKTEKSQAIILSFLSDENIKVRDEAKIFINSHYDIFSAAIIQQVDHFEKIKDLTFLNGILDLFESHPDVTKIPSLVQIIISFSELASVKARSVLLKILKQTYDRERTFNRKSEKYVTLRTIFKNILVWGSDGSGIFLSKLLETCGMAYFEILMHEACDTFDQKAKAAVNKLFAETPALYHDKKLVTELFISWDTQARDIFIKYLNQQKGGAFTAQLFSHIINEIPGNLLIELYTAFKKYDIDASALLEKYRLEIRTGIKSTNTQPVEILAAMKDPELLSVLGQDWVSHTDEVKTAAFAACEKYYIEPETVKFLDKIYYQEENSLFKMNIINLASKIDCIESTEIIMKAFNSPKKDVAGFAAKIIVARGKERLLSQLSALPEDIRNQLGEVILRTDNSFVEEMEKKLTLTEPKVKMQILKMLVHLSKGESKKVLGLLLKFAKDPDDQIRADFTKLLGLVGGKEVADVLINLIGDGNARVRANAIEVAAALNLKDIVNLVLPMTSHANNRVRANAIIALYKLGNTNVIVGLSEMLRSPDKWMRASATFALGEINDRRILPLLNNVLNDKDPDVVVNAIRVLKKVGDENSAALVFRFLNDENKKIRTEATNLVNHFRKAKI